jgi:hypothetical protein
MYRKGMYLLICLALLPGLSNPIPVIAQGQNPPGSDASPVQDANGRWAMPPAGQASIDMETSPQATGGPDDFGYTWGEGAPADWVDATSGTDAGLSGYSCGNVAGPINLPFTYKFYEKSYSQVWISAGGLIGFSTRIYSACMPLATRFPVPNRALNVIAPLWSMYNLAYSGKVNRVFYKSDGVSPNRRFIVEWNQVAYANSPYGGNTVFTFEVILYENGDFRFQYKTINTSGGYYCDDIAIGMQSWHGYDGLSYLDWCTVPYSNIFVQFTRPPDSARLQILNPYQGMFSRPNLLLTFPLQVVNTGTLGDDTYNLSTTSTWPLTFHDANENLLTDTNHDSIVDTGVVHQGELITVLAEAQTPTIINPGDYNNMAVTMTSTKNAAKVKIAPLQAAVPAPFAQAYNQGVYLVRPEGQKSSGSPGQGYNYSIAETPQGRFVYAWNDSRCQDTNCNVQLDEIWYTIFDRQGLQTRPAGKLVDLSGATIDTFDSDPTVSVAPDGSIGVAWYRWMVDSNGKRNTNIYYAILDSTGNLATGPVNLTNNAVWAEFNALNVTWYYSPVIAATSDNHFFLAWEQDSKVSSTDNVDNIAYAIITTTNAQVKAPTLLTSDSPGSHPDNYSTSATGLSGQRALVTYLQASSSASDQWYTILDSSGNVVKAGTNLSNDGNSSIELSRADGVQVNNGNTVVAWDTKTDLRFAVLDTSYNRIAGPTAISHPAMRWARYYQPSNFSLAADPTGHAVLTWMDPDYNNSQRLYYTLINATGSQQTPPMIFLYDASQLISGLQGYSNTSYSTTPSTPNVDAFIQGPANNPIPSNGSIDIPVQFGNLGLTNANSIVVTATLTNGLTYIGDTSGVMPTSTILSKGSTGAPQATKLTWNLGSSIGFLGAGRFELFLGAGPAAVGTTYPVTLTIQTSGSEAFPANNSCILDVNVSAFVFLPISLR